MKTKFLIRSGLLLAIAIVFQIIGRNIPQINQFLVGPIINAVLIITAYSCGIWWGIGVGLLTPCTAWILGQLATPLGPFIPFIAIGNMLFVLVYGITRKHNYLIMLLGIIIGAMIKYLFLYTSATKLIDIFQISFPSKILKLLVTAMGVPQLMTALIGGVLALLLIRVLNKRIKLEVK